MTMQTVDGLLRLTGSRGHCLTDALGAGWGDEAGLVGDDDELSAVPGLEFHEQPADVRFRGRGAEIQPLGDLRVGPAPGHQGQHLALAVGEEVEAGRRRAVAVRAFVSASLMTR